MNTLNVNASEVTQHLAIKVTGFNVMRARWAIAALVFRLAGVIAGCKTEVSVESVD